MGDRRIFKRIWDFLGSRDLSVFIFVMGMTYYLILAVFSTVIPPFWVKGISKLLPFKVLYLLFFINLVICEIKWFPVVARRCRKPEPPETPEELERFRNRIQVQSSEFSIQGLESSLKRRGYKVQGPGAGGRGPEGKKTSLLLYACKGRFSPMGNLLFHISFLFLLAGAGLSMFYRFDGTILLAEGQGISGDMNEYLSATKTNRTKPPAIAFKVERVTPAFWEGRLLFTELMAELSYSGGKGIVRLSQPLRIDGARLTISSVGIAAAYVLKDSQGRELDSGYANLAAVVPGNEDNFHIPDTPYRIFVSFYPDFELRNGKALSRSMNPVNPAFGVRVFNNKRPVFKGIVKQGEGADFEGLSLSFPEFKYSGLFGVVYDGGFVSIWAGFIFMTAGLVWKLLMYRKEIVIWEEGGHTFMAGHSDYYRALFSCEMRRMAS